MKPEKRIDWDECYVRVYIDKSWIRDGISFEQERSTARLRLDVLESEIKRHCDSFTRVEQVCTATPYCTECNEIFEADGDENGKWCFNCGAEVEE